MGYFMITALKNRIDGCKHNHVETFTLIIIGRASRIVKSSVLAFIAEQYSIHRICG